jgi:hypothetical protein
MISIMLTPLVQVSNIYHTNICNLLEIRDVLSCCDIICYVAFLNEGEKWTLTYTSK